MKKEIKDLLIQAGRLANAANRVVTSNVRELSSDIKKMEKELELYDSMIYHLFDTEEDNISV
jgi:hypothetical protein